MESTKDQMLEVEAVVVLASGDRLYCCPIVAFVDVGSCGLGKVGELSF